MVVRVTLKMVKESVCSINYRSLKYFVIGIRSKILGFRFNFLFQLIDEHNLINKSQFSIKCSPITIFLSEVTTIIKYHQCPFHALFSFASRYIFDTNKQSPHISRAEDVSKPIDISLWVLSHLMSAILL